MNRQQAPEVWWSVELGLIWSEDGRSYRRTEAGQVVEFFHLPAHAHEFRGNACCCGECEY